MVSRNRVENAGSDWTRVRCAQSLVTLVLEWRSAGDETAAVIYQDRPANWWFALGLTHIRDWILAAITLWLAGGETRSKRTREYASGPSHR